MNIDTTLSCIGGNIKGNNLFAYCMNNPINNNDSNGNWPHLISNIFNSAINKVKKSVNKLLNIAKQAKSILIKASKKSSHDLNRRPYRGKPGSTYRAPNGDTRTFGDDGGPVHDYDHCDHGNSKNHPHDENGGHNHDWVNGVRGPAYSVWDTVKGCALVTVSAVGMVIIAADDATGIGALDDFLLGPLGASISEGIALILG